MQLQTRIMENKYITPFFSLAHKMGRQRNPVMNAIGYSAIKHVMNEG